MIGTMKTFIAGSRLWPAGVTLLHVYALPRTEEIGDLVRACRPVLDRTGVIAPVADEWLHATLVKIGVPAAGVGPDRRADLVEALRRNLADVAPFRLVAGPPLATGSGVLLDLTPDDRLADLVTRVHTAAADVVGEHLLTPPSGPPHITLGYAIGDTDSGPVDSALRRIRPRYR